MGPHVVLLYPYFKCLPRVLMIIRVGKFNAFIKKIVQTRPDEANSPYFRRKRLLRLLLRFLILWLRPHYVLKYLLLLPENLLALCFLKGCWVHLGQFNAEAVIYGA